MPKTSPYKNSLFFFCLLLFFSSTSLFSKNLARDYFQKAKDFYDHLQYFEATGFLQQALTINPYYSDAQILLGDSYFAMGNYSSAWDIYLKAEKRNPSDADLLVKLARTKLVLADSREDILATEYYLKKAYQLAPRNASVFSVYGEFYMKLKDYQKALDYYGSLGNVLDNAQIFLNRSKIYEAWGRYDEALSELKKAESLDGKNYDILLALGKIYAQLKDYNRSLTYLHSAYSYNPKGPGVLQALADVYIKQKDFQKASEEIGQLILHDPTNPILYYNLALCYEYLGSFDRAVEILKEGLKKDYGNEFLRIKAEDIAIEKLPLSSPLREELAQFYINYAKILQKTNREKEALFFLKRALELTPLDVETRMSIAYIYRKKSYLNEYMELLQGGAFLDPKNTSFQDQIKLNQKFLLQSLAYKEQIDQKPAIPLEPIIRILDASIQGDSYQFFTHDAKKMLLGAILNNHSLNAFLGEEETPSTPKPQFNLQFTLIPTSTSLTLRAELTYIPTGFTYKTYDIMEHGNDRMANAFLELANRLENDIPKIGRILKIEGNYAIVNMGAQQGMTLGQNIQILNGADLPDKFFFAKTPDPSWEIAKGKVIELGENISKIFFKPTDRVIFNMVEQNQSIILKKG